MIYSGVIYSEMRQTVIDKLVRELEVLCKEGIEITKRYTSKDYLLNSPDFSDAAMNALYSVTALEVLEALKVLEGKGYNVSFDFDFPMDIYYAGWKLTLNASHNSH